MSEPCPGQQWVSTLKVNITAKTYDAMHIAAQVNEEQRTDVVNRAIQLYAYVSEAIADNAELQVRDRNGEVWQISLD